MENSITVLTAITGGRDLLREKQVVGDAQFIAYTDFETESDIWNIKPAHNRFKDPRRNSRIHKILSHQYCDTEYSIWIDGDMSLLRNPEELIEKYLKDYDLAVFKHNLRDCIYDEALRCATERLDDPEVIIEQASVYEKKGYAKHKGLCECGVLIRRHSPKTIEFNNFWWSEYCRHSVRDQISFMYAVDSVGLRINQLDMNWRLSPNRLSAFRGNFIELVPHEPA